MLGNLIVAYRVKYSVWKEFKNKDFWKANKMEFLVLIAFLTVFGVLFTLFMHTKKIFLIISLLIIVVLFAVWMFTHIDKEIYDYITRKKLHLESVIDFLQEVLDTDTLFTEKKVELIIEQLSDYIERHKPFNGILSGLSSFCKSALTLCVTFLAGAFSQRVAEWDWQLTLIGIIMIGIFLVLFYILGWYLLDMAKSIFYSNYNAAVSFRSDLQDIKLLYFTDNASLQQELIQDHQPDLSPIDELV